MKTMKVLKEHRYRGKLRKVGSEYPVARADIRLVEAMGWGRVYVPEEPAPVLPDRFFRYETTALEATKPKRKYVRKVKVEE